MTDSSVAAEPTLPHYRIHDSKSFAEATGGGHEIAGLYFRQQLDCLVDLAYKVACDFFKRPQLYIGVDGLSKELATLYARYGADETLPSDPQRDAVFVPIFGSGGVRTLPPGVSPQPEAGDFPVLREDLLKAAQAFAERAVDTGVEMLRARVRDAHQPMVNYLDGLAGDSVKWSNDNAFPTVTEKISYTLLRSTGIAAVFGVPAPTKGFPYVEEAAGHKLVENIWRQLAGTESPILNRDRISNLQRLALRGAEALATIRDFDETLGNPDLDQLTKACYMWDAALWSVKTSGTPQAADGPHAASPNGAPPPAPPPADIPTPAPVATP